MFPVVRATVHRVPVNTPTLTFSHMGVDFRPVKGVRPIPQPIYSTLLEDPQPKFYRGEKVDFYRMSSHASNDQQYLRLILEMFPAS